MTQPHRGNRTTWVIIVIGAILGWLFGFGFSQAFPVVAKTSFLPGNFRDLALAVQAITLFVGGFFGLMLARGRTLANIKQANTDEQRHIGEVQRQVTETLTRAIEQLSSASIPIRMGALYALERITRSSAHDHAPIIEILCAYVRERSPNNPEQMGEQTPVPTDVQIAASIVGRRTPPQDAGLPSIDLENCNLTRATFAGANLVEAKFSGSDLTNASFRNAKLHNAMLWDTMLHRTNLHSGDVSEAHIGSTRPVHASFLRTNLTDSVIDFSEVRFIALRRANLSGLSFDVLEEGLEVNWLTQRIIDSAFAYADNPPFLPAGLNLPPEPPDDYVWAGPADVS